MQSCKLFGTSRLAGGFLFIQKSLSAINGEALVDAAQTVTSWAVGYSATPYVKKTLPIKKEPTGLAGGSSYAPVRLCYQQRPNRRIANLASAFPLLAARKRATRVGKAKLRTQFILFQLFLYVIPNLLFVLAYRIHVVAPAPEFTIAVFELQIAKSFIQHQAAFTLRYPINPDTLILGGISSSICT